MIEPEKREDIELRQEADYSILAYKDENAWSDWLAHILEKSKTGFFAKELLNMANCEEKDYALPKVERETHFLDSEDAENRSYVLFFDKTFS